MNIDNAAGEVPAEIVRQDLHEAGEHDQLDVLNLDKAADSVKTRSAIGSVHFDEMKRNPGVIGHGFAIRAVANDRSDFDRQFAQLGAPQNLVETVIGFRDQNRRAHAVRQPTEMPVGMKRTTECAETIDEILHIDVEFAGHDFQAGEKLAAELVGKLVELNEVATMPGDIIGNFGDNSGLVRTTEFED